jgi:putative adenylate-forming enzyme
MNTLILLQLIWEHRKLRQRDHWTRRQLDAHQTRALRQLREHAYAHSPFYQRFHRGFINSPLREAPVLTKAMMMEHFDELVTDRAVRLDEVKAHQANMSGAERYLGRYWVNATSGSTGHPGLFLFNRSEWITVLASFARGYEWAGIKVSLAHRRKMAVVASTTPWHMSAQAGATLRSWWAPTLRLAASEPMESITRRLNAWQPETLVSYASMARGLADEQLAGHLHINPNRVFTSSEVLTKESRRRIEKAWGRRLFNQYAATECGGLAAECDQHQGMHLFEDLVICEVVDQDNRPAPPGGYGDKLLLTVLFGRTQPLIRYELSDSVRLAKSPCACGRAFTLIDDIQGRAEDVLWFPKPEGGLAPAHPITFHRVMELLPIRAWQIAQEADGLKVLLSGAREGFSDETLVNALRQALRDQGVVVPMIEVQHVEAIPRGAAGKAPLIRANKSSGIQVRQ